MLYSNTLAPWKQRFCIEYWELANRASKLGTMLKKWDNNDLDFTPTCSYSLLNAQYATMTAYKAILLERAIVENIDLIRWKDEQEK